MTKSSTAQPHAAKRPRTGIPVPASPGARTSALEPEPQEVEAVLALFRQKRYREAEVLAQLLTVRYRLHGFGWKALGAVLKQQGRQEEALEPLSRAVELMPENAEAHFNLGNCLLDQDRFAEAESCYLRALSYKPDYLAAHFNLGNALHRQARFAEAEASFRRLVDLTPQDAQAHMNLANILYAQKRVVDAEAAYRHALQLQPALAEAHYNLANFLKDQGRANEAETCYRNALDLKPNFAQANLKFGDMLIEQGRLADAEAALRIALESDPNLTEAYSHLGVVLREQGRYAEAEQYYRHALCLMPDYADAHNNLGNVLREQARYAEAAACYEQALALNPDLAEAHYNLGNVHKEREHYRDAEAGYRKALEARPHYPEAHNKLGNALKEQGRMEEAAEAFETAITLKPDFIKAHYSLSPLKTYRDGDPHVDMLEALAQNIDTESDEMRTRYWFTMGKVREDLGSADAAFAAYREGNRIKRATLHWDDAAEDAMLEKMMSVFSREFFTARPQPQHPGKAPIFIVGMPRSGTSLLEQILATHPGVYGAGELTDMRRLIVAAMPNSDALQFPDAVPGLSPQDFQRLGEDYADCIWTLAPDAERITDKLPSNFYYLGMIHLMLPHAKIIHAMRDPMDSCFSCYSRLFNEDNLPFTYDLETLGRYYGRYSKLMQHWRAVLPPGAILDMRYEDMVADTEAQARRLLDYLGLPWDEKCLDFHQNKRPVKTASAAQVRKPIYKTSLARWQQFGDHLGPLLALVKDYR